VTAVNTVASTSHAVAWTSNTVDSTSSATDTELSEHKDPVA